MANDIKYYYHKDAWTTAFSGNDSRIVFDTDGSVYKDVIDFGHLVVDYTGVIGPAGLPSDGQITIWANSHNGTSLGLIHSVLEGDDNAYNVNGGAIDTNDWHHIILKIDVANQLFTLKVDDTVVDTTPFAGDVRLFNKLQKAVLFRYLQESADYDRYDGAIDDFRIYQFVTTDQNDTDIYDWGNQRLQFEEKIYVPKQGFERGRSTGFKIETEDYMHIRNLAIEYHNINMR